MYLSTARSADALSGVKRQRIRGMVAANVVALGAVSLVTDISAEMVTAVLPLYLVAGLGLSPLAFGLLDGIYGGVSALVRLLGGHTADRWRRHKLVAGVGYALSAVCKPVLLVAGSVTAIGAVLAVDRTGKGLRTAPRDALISRSSPPDQQGRAFGVHRAMDTAGALLGPLAAFAVLWAAPEGYDAVFVVSFCIATLGVLLLVLFVREVPARRAQNGAELGTEAGAEPSAGQAVSVRAALALLRLPGFGRICLCALLLGTVTISDSFIFLLLQRRLDISVQYFPLLPLGTAAGFLALAFPLGLVADRIGRWRVFLAGHVALLGVYLLLLSSAGGATLLVAALALHGAFYAATDGVLMAVAAPLLPDELRGSGLGLVQTGQAVARFGASLLFGAAWTVIGPTQAITAAAVCLGLGVGAATILRPRAGALTRGVSTRNRPGPGGHATSQRRGGE